MSNYIRVEDKRDISKGMTPNKAIKRGPPPPVKKNLGSKQAMRRPQGK